MNFDYNYATVWVLCQIHGTGELMDRIFQKVVDNDFSDLKGTVANAAIPVSQQLVNVMIAILLEGTKSIAFCETSIHPENRADVRLKTTLLPWTLNLKLKLDRSVDFASSSSPKLRAWLENNHLLGSLASFLNVLPEEIKLYGNQVVLDLGGFVQTPEQRKLLELVRSADIRTEEGKVILNVKAEVN